MKYCSKCGNQLLDEAVMCPNCGCMVNNVEAVQNNVNTGNNSANEFAIIGFILSFILPILGLVFDIVGLSKSKELNGKGQGLSIAGICIGIIMQIIAIIQAMAIWNS